MFLNIYKYLLSLLLVLGLPLIVFAGEIDEHNSNNPQITVDSVKSVKEGNSGTTKVNVNVSIDKCPNLAPIRLRFNTENGTATTADSDYKYKSGTITFSKGSCSKTETLTFEINGDKKIEDDEDFFVKYYNNGTFPSQTFHWRNGNQQTEINIINDDGVVLDAGKYLIVNGKEKDNANYNLNDTITFVIYAQNQGPNSTKIKIRDDLTDAIQYIKGSLKITNNVKNYSCTENNNKIRCSGSHKFKADTEVDITFKAKAIKKGSHKNYTYITDDKGNYENGDHVNFNINDVGNGVAIKKTVDKSTVEADDNVTFTIKITNNTPDDRQLKIKDWFPTTQKGEKHSGTTKNAFKYISYSVPKNSEKYNVTCEYKSNSYGPYVFCKNNIHHKLKPGKSYTVKIKAQVLKTGKLCNRAHAYLQNKTDMGYSDVCLTSGGNAAPIIDNLKDENVYIGDNFSYSLKGKTHDPDGDPITISVSGLPDGFTYNSNTKQITSKPVTAKAGTYKVTVSATDDPSSHNGTPKTTTKTFTITIKYTTLQAKDNDYEIGMNETLEANVIKDDTGKGKDSGYKIKIDSYKFLTSIHGQFTLKSNGKLRYKPDQDFTGTIKFKYTIIDAKNSKSTAYVTITVKTQYNSSFKDFQLINPLETRNIIGNYVVSGNTVECVTDKNDSFDGTCQNDRVKYYNNKYVVKYIDIDNNDTTWDSSSSTLTLPNSYAPSQDGKNIIWAGLFWQGNVNNSNHFSKNGHLYQNLQKRSYLSSGSMFGFSNNETVVTKDINHNETMNILNTSANKILLKIDNESNYHNITASRFYYDTGDYGDYGATYAAYADITTLLQSKKLTKGKHKITVANILSNEGMEILNGDYAGWSIVVIYKEDFIHGKARNVSIYNGFTAVDYQKHGSQEVKISGFKLPKEGTVNSQFTVFAGEGEEKYGAPYKGDGRSWYDYMKIKRLQSDKGDLMPGLTSDEQNNIFDAKLANVQRDSGKNNDVINTNGIDIDTYDVSNIITKYRDKDNNISSIYIDIASNKDYITPSMVAFSTELYAPKVCYDSDVKIGEYIDVDTQDRNFTAYNYNEPLQMKIMIKSQEADFDLLDTKLKVKFNPNNIFSYKKGDSKTSIPNTYEYYNAIDTDPVNGEIAIGSSPTVNGGILGAKELTYSKMYYDFNKNKFRGKFDVVVDAKVSFDGVHKVEYQLSTEAPKGSIFNIDRCQSNPVYNPVYGMFNIERGNSKFNQTKVKRYSLYTQVVGVPYKVSVAAYKKGTNNDWSEKGTFDGTVELELIDASTFDNNSSAGFDSICNDPDTYNIGKFINFNNQSRIKVKIPDDFPKINNQTTYPENIALKNAAFRVWVLTKKDSNNTKVIVKHHCKSQSDSICFDKLYKNNYSASTKVCSSECTASTGTTCYECLRKNFGTPICSRDNFAIRPVSYDIAVSDDNETHSTFQKNLLGKNSSTSNINLTAGYLYHLDINATKYVNSPQEGKVAYGYYLNVLGDENDKKSLAIFNDASSCLDKNSTDIYTYILNGRSIGYDSNLSNPQNGLIINNSGKYKFHLEDSEWTMVDHKGYKYKPFKNHADCEAGSTNIYNGNWNAVRGCNIESNDTINGYNDLNLNMHPYRFNINNISAVSNPNNGSNYIYINNLDETNSSIRDGSVMGLKIAGDITAIGKNGNILTNYTNSCSANNLNINIDYKTIKNGVDSNITDISGNAVNFKYSIYNSSVDTPSSLTISNASNNNLNITFNKKYFVDSNVTAGKARFIGYFNFNRTYNNPVNPFKLHLGDFKANSILDSSSVDLTTNHIPKGFNKLDTNKTVYYAKAKPQTDFYDDITGNSVNTPMMIALFCNETLDICNNYGIDTNNAITNEYDWWINSFHNAANGEGDILINSDDPSKATINLTDISSFTNGINKNLIVTAGSGVPRPFTVHIVPTQTMKNKYPFLLFNKSQNVAPASLEGVRFINPTSAWSGEGKTGNAIDVNKSSGRKTNKLEW